MTTRIVVAQEHAVLRSALRALLETEPTFEVVGEIASNEDIAPAVRASEPDCIVVDCAIHCRFGAGGLCALLAERPGLAVIVLGMCSDEPCIERLFRAGVRGYVLKTSPETELVRAIHATRRGDWYIDSSLASYVTPPHVEDAQAIPQQPFAGLTERELEVCRLLAYGHTNAEVAEMLTVSGRTVEAHRARIMSKLKLKTRAELVRFALHHGLLQVH